MNYLIFYCFQLEQLVDLDMAINPSIKFSSYFKKPKLESFQKSKKFKLSLSSKLLIKILAWNKLFLMFLLVFLSSNASL
jgi:hypothetical protein